MLFKSEFSRNVLKVMTGTTFAQLLPLLVAPVLTRLYSPEEFGVYFLFAALLSLLSAMATGKYELAILLPKEDHLSYHILVLGGMVATGFCLLLFLLMLIFRQPIAGWLGEARIAPWLLLLPWALFAQGWYLLLNYWHNRHKRFGQLTYSKITLSSVNAGGRLSLGLLSGGIGGLIIGTLLGWISAFLFHLGSFWRKDRKWIAHTDLAVIRQVGKRYRHFPLQMIPGGLFNKGSFELPVLLINYFFLASIAGFYGHMQAIIRRPMQVVGRAFDEVFKQKANEELIEFGHCRSIFFQTFYRLSLIGALPFGLLFWLSPLLFEFVFGPEWQTAGVYTRYFAIPFFVQFVVSPLTSVFYLMEQTWLYSLLEFIQLCMIIAAVLAGYFFFAHALTTVLLLGIAYGLGYLGRFLVLLVLVRRPANTEAA